MRASRRLPVRRNSGREGPGRWAGSRATPGTGGGVAAVVGGGKTAGDVAALIGAAAPATTTATLISPVGHV